MATTTQERAQERVKRIAEAQSERDADHLESETMGYLAALKDECLIADAEHARLMNAARSVRMQWQANRIEGQYDTLKDRVVAAGYGNEYSDEEVAAMRTEMAVLSSKYFDLTGLTLS